MADNAATADGRIGDGGARAIREALESFVSDPRSDIVAMSREEVRSYLADEGINIAARQAERKRRFAEILGQERRERAAIRRQALVGGIRASVQRTQQSIAEARLELQRRLSPEGPAAALFRNLETATDDDVLQLLDDLDALETNRQAEEVDPSDEEPR